MPRSGRRCGRAHVDQLGGREHQARVGPLRPRLRATVHGVPLEYPVSTLEYPVVGVLTSQSSKADASTWLIAVVHDHVFHTLAIASPSASHSRLRALLRRIRVAALPYCGVAALQRRIVAALHRLLHGVVPAHSCARGITGRLTPIIIRPSRALFRMG